MAPSLPTFAGAATVWVEAAGGLLAVLESVPDPRRGGGRRHPLRYLLGVLVAALSCAGFETFAAVAQWAAAADREPLLALGAAPDPLWVSDLRGRPSGAASTKESGSEASVSASQHVAASASCWVRTVAFLLLLPTGGLLGIAYLALLLFLPPVATVEEYRRLCDAPRPRADPASTSALSASMSVRAGGDADFCVVARAGELGVAECTAEPPVPRPTPGSRRHSWCTDGAGARCARQAAVPRDG